MKIFYLGNSVEEILLEIQEKQSGYFWRLINGLPYVFFYCPIEQTDWTVLGMIGFHEIFKQYFMLAVFVFCMNIIGCILCVRVIQNRFAIEKSKVKIKAVGCIK